jgi:hypothetical protein
VTSRPYDWTALGLDADPVPGDPDVVSAESRRLGQTAQELRAQIALLKQISQDTTLKGQYAGTLRAHAQQLSTDLDKVATRYEDVAEATSEWSGNLADAQAQSLTALKMAQGPYEQLRKLQAPVQPAAGASAAAKQQYVPDKQAYQRAQSSAQAAMSDAQVLLTRATGHRDTTGAAAAGKINGAAHDSLADSWWDQFKQEIGAIADNLKTIATIIGYVATVCAILAVILTGPLALVFLLIAGGLLLTELGVHTILAATGNGSWVDVGLDVFALATLGYGGILDAGADAAEETASDAAVEAVQKDSGLISAAKGLVDQVTALKEEATELGDDEIIESVNKIADLAKSLKSNASSLARGVAKDDVKTFMEDAEGEHSSVLDVAKDVAGHGSRSTGKVFDSVGELTRRFPDNPQIARAMKTLKPLGTKNAATFLSGTAVDATDKSLSLTWDSYNHFKDKATYALPADIGIPVVSAAEMWTPTDFIVHETQLASK